MNSFSRLEEKVKETIRLQGMVQPGDRIVVGVSGGPDSVCLLRILHRLAEELQIGGLLAVHVNHGLRGADSDGDEAFVRDLAAELGVPFESVRRDVAALAESGGMGLEAAGRRARYEAFEDCRQKAGAQRIAVAHNRNDQAETILMRILRGTGVRGLRGMDAAGADGILIRPLLEADREDIEACCREENWAFRTDKTNKETIFTRNRIRLELIPQLEREYNPQLQEALLRLGRQAAEADAMIAGQAEMFLAESPVPGNEAAKTQKRWKSRWSPEDRSLDLTGFDALPPAVAKRVLQRCWELAGYGKDLTAAVLEPMYETALCPQPAEADGTGGRYVLKTYGKLWFLQRRETGKDALFSIIEGAVPLPLQELEQKGRMMVRTGAGDLVLELADRPLSGGEAGTAASAAEGSMSAGARLDWDKVKALGTPVFRNRRAGDRITPIGMKGSKKLQDFLVDRKIPRHQRDSLLLLAAEGRILQAGRETAADCAVTEDTRRILRIYF